ALGVTGLLSLLLARSITGPIQELTRRAGEMAAGNFDQTITVRSQDEIGRLSQMFNHLTLRLRETLGQISHEKTKLETILTHLTDGVIAFDQEGVLIHANPAAAALLGLSPQVSEPESGLLRDFLEKVGVPSVFAGEEFAEAELTLNSSPPRVVNVQVASVKDASGTLSGILVVLHDVTEAHRLEEMRREFVADVSHELRTPLTTIKSYVETLLDGSLNDPKVNRRFLAVVDGEADRMVRLVSDLLQLSQLDVDNKAETRPVDLKRTTEETIQSLSRVAEQKAIEILVELPKGPVNVMGDPHRLGQILLNVLSNALKYCQEKAVVRITLEPGEGALWVLRVTDNGPGIPDQDLPRIFDRFYRVDKGRSRELGGTGLGLSIAKQIVEMYGGTITIQSQIGKGTTVLITFPAAPEASG
ncbi:MAG: HAMP domain-containing protein, partial [Firmicutes bacterium]|nr:HAMP domain-containing protein [Bacillota bacterium]